MTSLYNRATSAQRRILRAVEGAIKDACHAHSELEISPHAMRSIAKRVAGTLSSQWREVLAAVYPPSSESGLSELAKASAGTSQFLMASGRRVGHRASHAPLRTLWNRLHYEMRGVIASGQTERAKAYIDVMRMIAALQRGESLPTLNGPSPSCGETHTPPRENHD